MYQKHYLSATLMDTQIFEEIKYYQSCVVANVVVVIVVCLLLR